LKATLAALEADLEDLEESVKWVCSLLVFTATDPVNRIVESTDARLFGLTDGEVQKRRRYVKQVKSEIEVGNC
jgi:hypothetical protein